ncbi:MAG TPA: NAD(P)-dependent oxidoreductase [Tepidisphaeraceae bacterium]|jgi:UDP-glucose 4-epimerase
MIDAATIKPLPQSSTVDGKKRRVLVTGASGNIGRYFALHNKDRYELRLLAHGSTQEDPELAACGEIVDGDITDLDAIKKLCAGIDTIVHMAGNPSALSTWAELLQPNVIGVYNTFVAAKAAGCKRVIFASSIHAVSGYPADVQVKPGDPVNPGDMYGVTKCFGEALARYMAEQEGLSSICLRIGAFQPMESAVAEQGVKMLDAWVSQRDLNQLIQRCVDVENLQFAIFNGLSDNRFKRLDITNARELLGYSPVDDTTRANPELKDLKLADRVMAHSVQDSPDKSGIRDDVK